MITGCNQSIGKAIAVKFASKRANLICAIRKEKPTFNEETDLWVEKYRENIDFVYFDLKDEDSIKAVFKELIKEKISIDILINNAGIPLSSFLLIHQANKMIDEKIRRKLKLTEEKVPYSMPYYGNTSSCTIPITMTSQIWEKLEEGENELVMCGFGSGLSW